MDDGLLRIGSGVLRLSNVLNWIAAAVGVVLLVVSFPLADFILGRLAAKYPGQSVAPILQMIRLMMILAIAASVALHVIFTRLLAIVATVRAGDPFVAANAVRLTTIGWALLAVQALDLLLGLIVGWFAMRDVETSAGNLRSAAGCRC